MKEDKLLEQIRTDSFSSDQTRFDYLIIRRDTRTITEKEFEELLKLTNMVEQNDLIRLKLIAKLADLKCMTLSETFRLYNLQPIQHD